MRRPLCLFCAGALGVELVCAFLPQAWLLPLLAAIFVCGLLAAVLGRKPLKLGGILLLAGAVLGLGAVLRTHARLNALQAAYDGKLLRKMQFAAASLLLTGALLAAFPPACGEDTVDLIHRFARETEHAEPNLARFARFAGPRRQKLFFALLLKP